ncbi:MAG: glycosyltransferase family 39 protein [Planctomycetes bacterium]|nr:glycosyltransferase family 39 protein [Planctomycetota bacterium]
MPDNKSAGCYKSAASAHGIFSVFFICYAIIFISTLPRYGLTWDTFAEYPRAAAYVEKFISGRESPSEVPADERLSWATYTYEQAKASNTASANGCFPSLVAAVCGKIFYQNLHWLGPIDAYNLGLALLWLFALAVFYYNTARLTNPPVAFLAAAFLALAPRLFEDAHNNMKDLPSAAFGGVAVMVWLRGLLTKRPAILLQAGVWFGISLASKHTSLVLLAPMGAAALFIWFERRARPRPVELLSMAGALIVSTIILFGHLPHLWVAPAEAIRRVGAILSIGAFRKIENPHFTDAALWMAAVSTPPVVLAAAAGGVVFMILQFRRAARRRRILLFTLAVWIAAVFGVWSSGRLQIYDGIRNFLHFWPALAVLSAIGATGLFMMLGRRAKLPRARCAFAGGVLALIPVAAADFVYHPHQLTYFNSFVGGFEGAQNYKDRFDGNICVFEPVDYWGSSIRQCVEWANANLPDGARIDASNASQSGVYYTFRPGLKSDCRDGAPAICNEFYAVVLERPSYETNCSKHAREHGTLVFEEKIRGVRLCSIMKLPGGFNPCHNPPSLSWIINSKETVTLQLQCEPCAAGAALSFVVGGRGEFEGKSFMVDGSEWICSPLRVAASQHIKNDAERIAIEALPDRVPETAATSGVIGISLPISLLARLAGPARTLAFVAFVGAPEHDILSNPVIVNLK